MTLTAQSEIGPLRRVLLKHPREAFRSQEDAAAEWRRLKFTREPDFDRACGEYDAFATLLRGSGAELEFVRDTAGTLDSLYVRDATVVSDRGVIVCRMGKEERRTEPGLQEAALRQLGIAIAGVIEPPGTLEGGDVVWLDERTVAVGRGYRTNDEGIRQLRRLLERSIDEMIVVPLPHWRGPGDVFHLMSILSPVDRDLAVVYAPLMPVPFRERLLDRGVAFVEVPHEEFESMGANVLALGPRRCVMLEGNPVTRRRLEAAGAEVLTFDGSNISLAGGGGPTCLTRPLARCRTPNLEPAG